MTDLHNFNAGRKSWQMYTKKLTSISGDDLTITPYDGKDLILEVSGNNQIIFKKGDTSYNLADLTSNLVVNEVETEDLIVNGVTRLKKTYITAPASEGDASAGDSGDKDTGHLIIGDTNDAHMAIDSNEIMARTGDSVGTLFRSLDASLAKPYSTETVAFPGI